MDPTKYVVLISMGLGLYSLILGAIATRAQTAVAGFNQRVLMNLGFLALFILGILGWMWALGLMPTQVMR